MFSVILMLRTYAFSGRKRWILAVLSITLFGLIGVNVWVMSRELTRLSRGPYYQDVTLTFDGIAVPLLFAIVNRTGCFAVSDQPLVSTDEASAVGTPLIYHLGVRLGLGVLV